MPLKQVVNELCQHAANVLDYCIVHQKVLLHFPASPSTLSGWISVWQVANFADPPHPDPVSGLFRCNRKTALKEAFSALMLAEPAAVAAAVQQLVARLRQQEAEGKRPLGAKDALALRLNSQYPEVGSVAHDIMVS